MRISVKSQSVFRMLPSKDLAVCFLILWIFVNNAKCQDLNEISKTLDEMLVNSRSFRRARDHEDTTLIWQEYEFGTGTGNREEVMVTNISLYTLVDITEKIDISLKNWQYLQTETSYLICAENSTLLFYKINLTDMSIKRVISIPIEGHILQFKILNFNVGATSNENHANYNLMAILLVKSQYSYFLYWYNIFGNTYMLYLKWPVWPSNQIRDMEFVRGENQQELLLLDNDDAHSEGQSLIHIYGFNIDYNNHRVDIGFYRRLFVPRVFNVQVCPIHGRTWLAFQGIDNVVLYESKYENKLHHFEKLKTIESNKLANFACFESGYIEYLAIGGKELRLFHFFENDFQDNEMNFDETTEILWVVTIPIDTYRNEALLLVQFKNLTVSALAWHGSKFKAVPLSDQVLNNYNLSKIVVIPKVGFVHGDTLVRIEVALSESAHPIHEAESVLKTRTLLEEVFRKQEAIFDETEARFNQSYLENPGVAGFWNLSRVNASNATIKRHVNYGAVKVGSVNLNMEDISTNVTSNLKKLEEVEAELDRILPNLKNVTDPMRITLPSDVELTGDLLVSGTLYTKNVVAAFINDASTSTVAKNSTNRDIINGQKSFPSIDTNNLTILALNGMPLEEIVFDVSIKNYSDVNFSKLRRLKVDGHLSFSELNNIKWKELMQNTVWKDESAIISEETIVERLVAEDADVKNLNRLQYPENYVLINDQFPINVMGKKRFVNLSTAHLLGIEAINKIDIGDFIVLNRPEIINEEITFENLEIEGPLQIDGNITAINVSNNMQEGLLNETDNLLSDVIFENLIIMGNIVLKDSINTKAWSDLDDFLLKTEKDAVIIGNKRFSNDVAIKSRVTIESREINDHLFSEFVTLNTNQQFPYLAKISADVTFGNATVGIMKKLEDYIIHEQNIASGCLNKILLFTKSFITDELSFDTMKQTISQTTFLDRINETFRQVYFENLTISTLETDEILPNTINGINYTDLAKRVLTLYKRQNLTGALILDHLETDILDVEIINGIPLNTWNLLLMHAKTLYDDVFKGNASIRSLRVTGMITTSSINNNDIIDIYKEDDMATVTFDKNVSIENLKVIGFVNNLNLSEFIADVVQKTDRNITFTDRKTFRNVTCEFLKVQYINGHFVNDILDPNKEQTLKGPIVINGSVTVSKSFNTTGKIGNSVFLNDFTDRFKTLENNSYALRGNFYFVETASITRLNVSGSTQGSMLGNFLETIIFKNDTDVTIRGLKSFKNSVTFNSAFNINGTLNDLDLYRFYENVVYIDKPFSIGTKVIFREDVYLQKNLVVKTKLQSNTIMGVDIKDLQENIIDFNKPKYISVRMTLDNVTFQKNVKIMRVNDLQMDLLVLLNARQFITIDKLNCTNVTVRNIQMSGRINTYYMEDIYADTFMIHGNQNITGCIKIRGNIYAYHDFNAHLINNFNPAKIVSLTATNILTGNFMFKTPVVLDKSLRISGLLNRIRPINWERVSIRTTDEAEQIISGKWRVHGNIYFEENVDGNEFLNDVNVTDVSSALSREHPEIDHVIEETREDLNNVCALHLDVLKYNAVNQIYKFNSFDYLKILEFEGDVHDIRNVEVNDVDYMLVNYNVCHMKLLSYIQTDFQVIDEVSDFGLIGQWIFFKSNRVLYLLTIAKRTCGRSPNNIWKLENNRLMHVLELGNATDLNLYQDEFVAAIRKNFEAAPENVHLDILRDLILYKNEKLNYVSNSDFIVSANQSLTYELQGRSLNGTRLKNFLDYGSSLNFKVGIYEREEYVHYDEEVSEDYIYLCKNDILQTRILQTIKARRPKSFLILHLGGSIETLFIFVENNDIIQVYEYAGIEGFVHRNTIQIKVDKLYNFKIRKYNNLERRHCLAVIRKNRLTILEAKMYGEKLDLRTLDSYTNAC